MRRQFDDPGPRHVVEAGFRGVIRGGERVCPVSMDRADHDDAAALALVHHLPRRELAGVKCSPENDAQGPFYFHRLELEERAPGAEGGVVHKDIHAA